MNYLFYFLEPNRQHGTLLAGYFSKVRAFFHNLSWITQGNELEGRALKPFLLLKQVPFKKPTEVSSR